VGSCRHHSGKRHGCAAWQISDLGAARYSIIKSILVRIESLFPGQHWHSMGNSDIAIEGEGPETNGKRIT
jgi:hypothetical protein